MKTHQSTIPFGSKRTSDVTWKSLGDSHNRFESSPPNEARLPVEYWDALTEINAAFGLADHRSYGGHLHKGTHWKPPRLR